MTVAHRTTCPLDCPDTCALTVTVEAGKVVTVGGVENNGITDGFICSKVGHMARRIYHEDRLTTPLRRTGPKGSATFEPISWSDAIEEITQRYKGIIEEFGGEAILPFHYGGSNGVLTDGFLDRLYFARLGSSRLDKTICAVPSGLAAKGMYGKMAGVAFEDYVHARCIVVWGANPKASNIHLVPFIKAAKKNGAFVAVVDPRRNFSRSEVDLHVPVNPGTDLALALALVHWWDSEGMINTRFLEQHSVNVDVLLERAQDWPLRRAVEVCGVPREDIIELGERYAGASTAVIRCGWGLERNRNGAQAIAAVLALPAILGKFGKRGGGYTMSNSSVTRANVDDVLGGIDWQTRSINMSQLGRALDDTTDPPLKGLFVYNANPVATVPDQTAVVRGLARDDIFTVVFDQVMTDTAVLADIVLPATTFLEHEDINVGYGSYVVGGVQPAIEAVGDARPNGEVFAELGRAMGFSDEAFTWSTDEHFTRVASQIRLGKEPANVEALSDGEMVYHDFPGKTPVQFETVFPNTPDNKIQFAPAELGADPYVFLPSESRFPLALITPSSSKLVTSMFGEFNLETLSVTVHPDDAVERELTSGQMVRVFNELGEVRCTVKVSDRVRPGVVMMPKGAWRKSSGNGWTSTALCPDHVNTVGGAACFNDARVEIAPLPSNDESGS